MRHIQIYLLLLLPMLWGCSDDYFYDIASQQGPIKYLFVADIDTTQVESRVAFDPLDHGHDNITSPGHYHDLALHWEAGDEVTLNDGVNSYIFTAEELDTDGDPSTPAKVVFTYRSSEVIANASSFTGTATYTPTIVDGYIGHQSENTNSDHLKNFGPVLKATLKNVDLTDVTGQSWLKSGSFTPIRFRPDASASEYAYFKIEVNGFKYPIWGKGNLWIYVLEEGVEDFADHHEPWAQITFGNEPTNMVTITGSPKATKDSEKYLWPNLKAQDTSFKLGTKITERYATVGDYPVLNADGTKVVNDSIFMQISFPNTNFETPFINVPEYFKITPNGTNDYTYAETSNPENFEAISQHYKLNDITGHFYVPVKKRQIKGKTAGNLYIATVLQCGWSGDIYVWEKKVPTDINIEGGKFYVLDYSKHKPEFAVKFAEGIYFRSTFLEQTSDNTDAPRYTLFGEKAELNSNAASPNLVVGPDMMTSADVKAMMKNHGAFMVNSTPMCAIFPGTKKVKWHMTNDTTFEKTSGNLANMVVYKTDASTKSIPYANLTTADNPYNKDGGYWDTLINRSNVCSPDNYLTTTISYMSKIAKGIINIESKNSSGYSFNNAVEYVLQNKFDPVMKSTKTCNLWRAPYGAEIYAISHNNQSVLFRKGKKLVIESSINGHRICLPYLNSYSTSSTRSKYTDGSGKITVYPWKNASESAFHVIGSRSVRTFGSNNPAYMQALVISHGSDLSINKITTFSFNTKFNMALPILPVFRWELPSTSPDRLIAW